MIIQYERRFEVHVKYNTDIKQKDTIFKITQLPMRTYFLNCKIFRLAFIQGERVMELETYQVEQIAKAIMFDIQGYIAEHKLEYEAFKKAYEQNRTLKIK